MTEDKAKEALRKVIINFSKNDSPIEHPIIEKDMVKVDVTDKVSDGCCCFEGIRIEYGSSGMTKYYISCEAFENFKASVEQILDAVIVNTKQRESVQGLLNKAYWDCKRLKNWLY